jgi:hypothetical protein
LAYLRYLSQFFLQFPEEDFRGVRSAGEAQQSFPCLLLEIPGRVTTMLRVLPTSKKMVSMLISLADPSLIKTV